MTAAVLAACLVLASSAEVRQLQPQRVEQATELRWCTPKGGDAELIVVSGMRVDGRPVGEQTETTIYRIRRSRPALDGD